MIHDSIITQNQIKYNEQKNIFAELLKKRNNRFNRIAGSKVLVKYD